MSTQFLTQLTLRVLECYGRALLAGNNPIGAQSAEEQSTALMRLCTSSMDARKSRRGRARPIRCHQRIQLTTQKERGGDCKGQESKSNLWSLDCALQTLIDVAWSVVALASRHNGLALRPTSRASSCVGYSREQNRTLFCFKWTRRAAGQDSVESEYK